MEALTYGGAVSASSFGTNYAPDVFGGRAALRVPIGQLRWQTDLQGEHTGNYSSTAGYRSYVAGGIHVDWMWMPNSEIGAFAGLQDATPTFFAPTNTNYFLGVEGRQFLGPVMLGAQLGRFDAIDRPGTLKNASFAEGRVKVSVGDVIGATPLKYTFLGGELGYGSGTASASSMGARTTYWGADLTQGIANSPFSLFVTYQHFENRVDGLGQVWNENMIMGGLRILVPSTDIVEGWKEPTVPLPLILRHATNF